MEMKSEIINQLWDSSISHACTELRSHEENPPYWERDKKLDLAKVCISLCLETGKHQFLQSIIHSFYDGTLHNNSLNEAARSFFLPLLSWCCTLAKTNDTWSSLPSWIEFAERFATSLLDMLAEADSRYQLESRLSKILDLVHFQSGYEYLMHRYVHCLAVHPAV